MKKHTLLYVSFALLLGLAALHWTAIIFYFYWDLWWFDNLAHFLGGLSIGLLSIWVLWALGALGSEPPSGSRAMILALLSVLVVGLGWEVFEYINGLTDATEALYYMDVTHDLIADLLGATLAGYIARHRSLYIGGTDESHD